MREQANQRVWTIAIISTLIVMVWFLWPQLSVLVFTALMAFVFYPLYTKLKRGKGYIAATITLLSTFLIVLIPVGIVAVSAVSQLASFAESASQSQYWNNLPGFAEKAIEVTNDVLEPITGQSPSVTSDNVVDFLKKAIPAAAQAFINASFGLMNSLPQLGIGLIVYIFVFVEFLLTGPQIIKKIKSLSPFDNDSTQQYLEKIGLMANAMVKGQLIISMIFSLIAAILLSFIGYGHYFFLLFLIMTVLNFIPLGAGILVFPLGAIAMFTGQPWMGLAVIVIYALIGNIDPLLRAWLIPDKVQLSTGLTMVATFCGIAYFGMLGVVYGPIIMIVATTTIEFYGKYVKKTKEKTPARLA